MFCAYNLLNLLQLTRAISEYVPITFQSQKPHLVGRGQVTLLLSHTVQANYYDQIFSEKI